MIKDLGKVAITAEGNWLNNKTYAALTIVVNAAANGGDGCGYVSLKANIGVRPGTNPTIWEKCSEAGQSIYQLCVARGYEGTEDEFVAEYNAAIAAANAAAASASAAEAAIAAAEAERVSAENARVLAEDARVAAENARVAAENARVEAESLRDLTFAQQTAAIQTALALADTATSAANSAADAATSAAAAANSAAQAASGYAERVSSLEGMMGKLLCDLGYYSIESEVTLTQAKASKYVNVSGTEVSQSGYGISSPISLNKGDILLIPSASAVPAAVSVVARVVTRTYDKMINYTYTYQQANPELYDTATADYDSSLVYTAVYDTSGDTPVLTGWTKGGQTYETLPATHEVTESYYEPLVQQAVSAMPSTGYYVYLCPQAMTVVISGYTATVNGGVCQVVGLGIFKNIATNFVGVPGQSVLAQALCDLAARVEGICNRLENLGDTKAKCIDFEDIPKVCDGPMVIEGTGSPSILPRFVGQRYHDTTANAKHLYEAFAVTGDLSDWVLIM